MKTIYAAQYDTRAVKLDKNNLPSLQEFIDKCREIGAVYYEDGPEDECFVVDVGRGVGPELYTAISIKGSLKLDPA